MSNKIVEVKIFCDECGGEGEVSSCCNTEFDEHRCGGCGRFCGVDTCHNCEGAGYNEYHVGDEVDVFVCIWSEEYLQNQLYKPKYAGDSKEFTGKIIEFVDKWNTVLRIGKKKVNVKLDDISQR